MLLALIGALAGGLLARWCKLPLLLGYLVFGLLLSFVADTLGYQREALASLAETGVSLLMFSLGLEFSLSRLGRVKRVAITGAVSQIALTTLFGFWLLVGLFGQSPPAALVMAAAFSLSSTAVVVKYLDEKSLLESLAGEIQTGWLLVQDLAVLPLITLIPLVLNSSNFGPQAWLASVLDLSKAALVLITVGWVSWKFIPKVADRITVFKSRELLLLFAVCCAALLAVLTQNLGFSWALGAFLAGLILGRTSSHLAIFSEIRPLRDVFLAFFFVFLGLSLAPELLWPNLPVILGLSVVFLLLKGGLVGLFLLKGGYHARTVLSSVAGLAGVGEFSFLLAAVALTEGFITATTFSIIAAVALLTMVLTPVMFRAVDWLYPALRRKAELFPPVYRRYFAQIDDYYRVAEPPFADHIVIIGHGRVGRWVSKVLDKTSLDYVTVEYDPTIVRRLRLEGKKVIYGDPTDIAVLDYAQVDQARQVILAIPDVVTQRLVVANCRSLNPGISVISRLHQEELAGELKSLGVTQVIHPEFETALSIAHQSLQTFGYSRDQIGRTLKAVRSEHW